MLGKIYSRLFVNSSRFYLDKFAKEAAESVQAGAFVLDAGAGNCPYKKHFAHTNYESADFCQVEEKEYGEITYVCDLSQIPVEDGRFDLVLFSQTLEHMPEPQRVLNELYRVLKLGGTLWLTAPFFYEEHETPFDYYRYTQYGLQYLLKNSGFSIARINWLEGYFGTLAYQLHKAAKNLPLKPRLNGTRIFKTVVTLLMLFVKPLLAILSLIFSRLDLHQKYTLTGQCKNYEVVAIKD